MSGTRRAPFCGFMENVSPCHSLYDDPHLSTSHSGIRKDYFAVGHVWISPFIFIFIHVLN